jgi:amidase
MEHSRRDFLLAAASLAVAAESTFAAKVGSSDFAKYDGLGLAELVKTKQVSPLELVDEVARRIERVNSKLNAVLVKNFDFEKARDRAKAGVGSGPFAGTPVMLKNLTDYKDARIDSGSRLMARFLAKNNYPAGKSSPLVDAMEQSGMIITGITNAPEFGLIDTTEPILHGATHNPWNPGRTSGGSSGGTAAAVAAGIVPLAHGNDGGGSIRIPSCQCGLFGLKPTRGRELGNGGPPGSNDALNISSDLCLSRSVRDTAAFLNVVENKNNAKLPPVGYITGPSKKRLKIALVLESLEGKKPDPAVEKAIRDVAKLCDGLGHHVDESKLDIDGPEFIDAFIGFWASDTVPLEGQVAKLLGPDVKPADVLEPWTLGLIEMGKSRGQGAVQRAIKTFGDTSARLEKMFQSHDVILSPVMRLPPYPLGDHAPTVEFKTLLPRVLDVVGYTPLHNAVGSTAMSVPLEWTADGLPVGSQFAAWKGGESTLLQLAYELEAAHPWAAKRPRIFAG